jgi:hypothetical protein
MISLARFAIFLGHPMRQEFPFGMALSSNYLYCCLWLPESDVRPSRCAIAFLLVLAAELIAAVNRQHF